MPAKKSKVLVVEDDASIRELMGDYLTKNGYEVSLVIDGPEAVEHVKQRGLPHIALVDLIQSTTAAGQPVKL